MPLDLAYPVAVDGVMIRAVRLRPGRELNRRRLANAPARGQDVAMIITAVSEATHVVGEAGPEIFRPRRAGDVVPNDAEFGGAPATARASAGPVTVNVNVSNSMTIDDNPGRTQRIIRGFAETLAREFEVTARAAFADEDA